MTSNNDDANLLTSTLEPKASCDEIDPNITVGIICYESLHSP